MVLEPVGPHDLRVAERGADKVAVQRRPLRLAPGEVPYCRVKGGGLEARLTPAAAYQLAQFLEYDEATNSATLCLAGACYLLSVEDQSGGRVPPR